MGDLVSIDVQRRRKEIEDQYSCTIDAWNAQYLITTKLMKADLKVKIALATADRDREIAKLLGTPYEPSWPLKSF